MKTLKIFIAITVFLLIVALGAGVYVWFKLQEYERAIRQPAEQQPVETSREVGP